MNIRHHLVLSTAHIRHATADLLTRWAELLPTEQPLAVSATLCGWFVPTGVTDPTHLPAELFTILVFGRAQGCSYVLLDSDGEELDALPIFPW
jgi:hypothetical protein